MNAATKKYYENRGNVLVKNLKSRHFDAYYCDNKEQALEKALELIPADAVIGWGGATSAQQIGLMETLNAKGYHTLDRDKVSDMAQKLQISKQCLLADVFLTGANAISLDGQMVNIDGTGNRVAAIVYGPDMVLVIAGMNKVTDTLEEAMTTRIPVSLQEAVPTASAKPASAIRSSSPATAALPDGSSLFWLGRNLVTKW